jgi:hypothetical protein
VLLPLALALVLALLLPLLPLLLLVLLALLVLLVLLVLLLVLLVCFLLELACLCFCPELDCWLVWQFSLEFFFGGVSKEGL